jgi:uncharacterized radical SAM superfamily Fe-S cluster-containing enzyme
MPKCNALTNHAVADIVGRWRPCCRFIDFSNKMLVEEYTLKQYKESKYFQNIVKTMEEGWHPGCEKCRLEEQINKKSLRQKMNKELSGENGIELLELSLSKQCNLTCRMCGPTYSSSWIELIKNNPDIADIILPNKDVNSFLTNVFEGVDVSQLKIIKYLGGEPFITTEIKKLFELLDNNGIIENIELQIASNCTLFPKKLIKYISRFKKFTLYLSIDGMGILNEYIRNGNIWNDILLNFNKWKEYRSKHNNLEIWILTTIQAYNLHQMTDLKNFAVENDVFLQTHLLSYPRQLSIDALPPAYLKEITDDENSSWIDTANYDPILFEEFKTYTLSLDRVMKKDIKEVIPKLYKYF